MLLVLSRRKIPVMPAVTAVLLHHIATYTETYFKVVNTGVRGNGC